MSNNSKLSTYKDEYNKKMVDFIEAFINAWQDAECPTCEKRFTVCARNSARRYYCCMDLFAYFVDAVLEHFAYPNWEDWMKQNNKSLNEKKCRKMFQERLRKIIDVVMNTKEYKWSKEK